MKEVFDQIHHNYDRINDLITFGTLRFFKWLLFKRVPMGAVCLDLASGTGDNLRYICRKFQKIVCVDPSGKMLDHIAFRYNSEKILLLERRAEEKLDLKVDCVTVTFGFRNFSDPKLAMQHISNYVDSGGKMFVMDVFKPSNRLTSVLLNLHFKCWVIPLGRLVSGNQSAYEYFRESIFNFLTFEQFNELVESHGFQKTWSAYVLGLGMCEFTRV